MILFILFSNFFIFVISGGFPIETHHLRKITSHILTEFEYNIYTSICLCNWVVQNRKINSTIWLNVHAMLLLWMVIEHPNYHSMSKQKTFILDLPFSSLAPAFDQMAWVNLSILDPLFNEAVWILYCASRAYGHFLLLNFEIFIYHTGRGSWMDKKDMIECFSYKSNIIFF